MTAAYIFARKKIDPPINIWTALLGTQWGCKCALRGIRNETPQLTLASALYSVLPHASINMAAFHYIQMAMACCHTTVATPLFALLKKQNKSEVRMLPNIWVFIHVCIRAYICMLYHRRARNKQLWDLVEIHLWHKTTCDLLEFCSYLRSDVYCPGVVWRADPLVVRDPSHCYQAHTFSRFKWFCSLVFRHNL